MQRILIDARGPNDPQTPLELEIYAQLTRISRMRMTIAGMNPSAPGDTTSADVTHNVESDTDEPDRSSDNK